MSCGCLMQAEKSADLSTLDSSVDELLTSASTHTGMSQTCLI